MSNIIDSPMELFKLSRDELDEKLFDEKYNKALLRELVRKSLGCIRTQSETLKYHIERADKCDEKIERLKDLLLDELQKL